MSLLGLGAWVMYGALSVADFIQSSTVNSERKEQATKDGCVTYTDAKGNERMISTGKVVMRWTENGETVLIDPKTMETVYNITAAEKKKAHEEAPHFYDSINQKTVEFAKENGYVCATQYFRVCNSKGEIKFEIAVRDIKTGKIIEMGHVTKYDEALQDMKIFYHICYYDSDESFFNRFKLRTFEEVKNFYEEHTTERPISDEEEKKYRDGKIKTSLYIINLNSK